MSEREKLSTELKASVWYFTHGRCWYCGVHLNPFSNLCIDHVVPKAGGGGDEIENLVPCCTTCNSSKGSKRLDEWRVSGWFARNVSDFMNASMDFFFETEEGDIFKTLRRDEINAWHRGFRYGRGDHF